MNNSLYLFTSNHDLLYNGLCPSLSSIEYFNSLSYSTQYVSTSSYSTFLLECRFLQIPLNDIIYYRPYFPSEDFMQHYYYLSYIIKGKY